MFWVVVFLSMVSIMSILFAILNKPIVDEVNLINSIIEERIESEVIVVDKMIVFTQKRKNKYILFIQLESRKILEVNVSLEVYNSVNPGDYGVIEEVDEGIYGFEKVS